jgi:microcystin-dependent protein
MISDQAASGAWKKVQVSALASAGSVASLGGLTGVVGLGPGITVNGSNIQDDPAMIGEIRQVAFNRVPANFLAASGGTRSRTTFAALYAQLVVSSTVTISNASPAVVAWTGNQLQNNDPILLTTTGGLPTGLATATKYYVRGLSGNNFNLSATPGGTPINTSSAGTGVQTAINAPWEGTVVGDGSTTFTLPDLNGRFLRGIDNGDGTDINRSFGTSQADAFKSHTHVERFNDSGFAGSTTTASSPTTRMEVNITGTQYSTQATGDVETRPVNQTVLFVIRYQ